MRIIDEWPPNIYAIQKAFSLEGKKPVFAYGDVIYNPYALIIPGHLMAHEEVHGKQQGAFDGGADAWWALYIQDKDFRLSQELEAYRMQYNCFKKTNNDRNEVARFLHYIICDISGSMYGNMIGYQEAFDLIKK